MNNISTSAIKGFFEILPAVTNSLMQCDEIMREHEERQAMKYSDQEYLKAVHRLYKSGRISGDQALKAMEMIYGGKQQPIKTTDVIEQQLLKMIG